MSPRFRRGLPEGSSRFQCTGPNSTHWCTLQTVGCPFTLCGGLSCLTLAHTGYATFCSLGGCNPVDLRAHAAGLPPIDSKDLTALINGTNTSTPHSEVVLSAMPPTLPGGVTYFGSGEGIVSGKWKLVTGVQLPGPFGGHTGLPRCDDSAKFPSHAWGPSNPGVNCDCGDGCLFDIETVRTGGRVYPQPLFSVGKRPRLPNHCPLYNRSGSNRIFKRRVHQPNDCRSASSSIGILSTRGIRAVSWGH